VTWKGSLEFKVDSTLLLLRRTGLKQAKTENVTIGGPKMCKIFLKYVWNRALNILHLTDLDWF